MTRYKAIKAILYALAEEDIAIFTTGMISREAHSIKDRATNLYMLGSMGLVSSVALGLALNTEKLVLAIDGDGSALMDMGTMALIAYKHPKNLIHIVLDNASYESTGGQPSISNHIDFVSVARSVGYSKVFYASTMKELSSYLSEVLCDKGPTFLLLKVKGGRQSAPPRVTHTPTELVQRLRIGYDRRCV